MKNVQIWFFTIFLPILLSGFCDISMPHHMIYASIRGMGAPTLVQLESDRTEIQFMRKALTFRLGLH